ncbi:rhomboid family intramembrane serine protease [Pontibacter arcticus]|uniref:Rhomboid family intramembrane serine protease n=1 Tax=Pontibacter arcticus TaxID=2080288 RepID=A0A364RD90_9BACT|nr:rhomboid family intramembrane serine protease [Pontibacter arcticus]RAU82239.1 rhomboid family intramembrane serine protease [Pontibacter arcticus]
MFNITPMVRNLLIINILVFVLQDKLFSSAQFALYHFGSEYFRPYQLVTHMFLHGGWGHLFSNMFSLFIFGPMLERYWGSEKLLAFYLICGLGASLLYSGVRAYELHELREETSIYMENPSPVGFNNFMDDHVGRGQGRELAIAYLRNPDLKEYEQASVEVVQKVYNGIFNTPMLGASGAVFALLMAFGMLFPNLELMLLFLPVPIKAKYFVMLYGAYELYTGFNRVAGDNVAHFAHLGGMLFAYILIRMWQRNDYREY